MTALVALLGVFITIWKHLSETSRQRKIDREQHEAERQRQFDDQFNKIVECLGSSNISVKAGSVISLQTFLKKEYKEFHNAVFDNSALKSIVKSYNWRKAHFDGNIMERLELIEKKLISSNTDG